MISVEGWKYIDFLTYLFILSATADLEMNSEEEQEIIKKVGEEEYKKVKRFYDQQNDSQHIEVVSVLFKKFKNEIGGKENLIRSMKEFIRTSHQREHVMESSLMMMLRKIL